MRVAKLISLEEFKTKMEKILSHDEFPYEGLPAKANKDLEKINFDLENFEYEGDGFGGLPCGYETLDCGLQVLFMNAGGDWEQPLCFCFYWDGKGIRAYIPEKGNTYNKKYKSAYGNNEDEEEGNKDECDPDAIREDICGHIKVRI